MQKLLLVCIFFISSPVCFAQQKETDSLLNLLQQQNTDDKKKLALLNNIAFSYHLTDPVKGILYADTARMLAETLKDSAGIARSYHNKATNYRAKSQFGDAFSQDEVALEIFQRLENKPGMAAVFDGMGITCKSIADYPKSLEFHFKALRLFEQLNDKEGTADVLMNIALVYNQLSKYEQALEYLNKSLAIVKGTNEKNTMANLLSNMASTFDYLGKPDSALKYFDQSYKLYREVGNKRGIASGLLNIAMDEMNTEQNEDAWDKLHEAEKLFSELDDKISLSLLCYHAAYLYSVADTELLIKKGIRPGQRYQKIMEWTNRGIALAKETGSILRQSQGLRVLSSVYEDQKDYEKALIIFQEYAFLNDSIFNDTKKQAITQQEEQYKFSKKQDSIKAVTDRQQAVAAAQIKQQQTIRNVVIAGTAILLLSAALLFLSYKKRRDAQEQQKEAEFSAQVSDTEMKALRSQMNPHFIFNSLNSINDYIDKNETGTASFYITKFARLMRMILENSEQKEVTLDEDLKALELYMQLESLRMKNKLSYVIKVDEAIDMENTLVPPLILQPFVENSIWHGISKKEGEGKISIYIKKEGDMINCIVEDNGIGRGKTETLKTEIRKEASESLGMKITKARIDILNKMKKSNAGVELTDLAEGLKVEVKLPYELSY